ncbi:MAG: selenide, water dikinase SelD [Marinifilaceae bacterium]|jgi:selenide,water dikinase|nr:selenide, water dikinase SelD [Marinifilaceae bacterium]
MDYNKDIKLDISDLSVGYGIKFTMDDMENRLRKNYFNENDKYHRSVMSDNTAYYDLGNGQALTNAISYFPMLMKDFYNYGKFAACASLNEVYASGYKPISASIIAGWPQGKYTKQESNLIIKGANEVCESVGIKLIGGYNVKSDDLFFGLSVNGIIDIASIKCNKDIVMDNDIYLTKPLGFEIALLAMADNEDNFKKGEGLLDYMTIPNTIGAKLSKQPYVNGMTNLSCFGLLGHLTQVAKYHNMCCEIYYQNIPKVNHLDEFIDKGFIPKETIDNWNFYKKYTNTLGKKQAIVVSDPVNSGGILMAVDRKHSKDFEQFCKDNNTEAYKIGRVKPKDKENIYVNII